MWASLGFFDVLGLFYDWSTLNHNNNNDNDNDNDYDNDNDNDNDNNNNNSSKNRHIVGTLSIIVYAQYSTTWASDLNQIQ